jgi:hypothetical protein
MKNKIQASAAFEARPETTGIWVAADPQLADALERYMRVRQRRRALDPQVVKQASLAGLHSLTLALPILAGEMASSLIEDSWPHLA